MDLIDLHTHSSYSDGTYSPRQLVQLAKRRGLRAIALTDHDTVAGVEEAEAVGKELGVEVVPGLEISAEYSPGTMHILGYCLRTAHPGLIKALEYLQKGRAARNPKIIERLRALGLEISAAEVQSISGGQIGRPHIARALVQKGYVSSLDDAFVRYLKKGAPAYVERFRFTPREAIAMIREAGGLAALAHPLTLGIAEDEELTQLVELLCEMGLEGMEVFYPDHTEEMTVCYKEIAQKFGLLCMGGSDFHGDLKNGSYLGSGGQLHELHYALLQDIRQRLRKR